MSAKTKPHSEKAGVRRPFYDAEVYDAEVVGPDQNPGAGGPPQLKW